MTENKATSTNKTFIIKPVSESESKNALKESKKIKLKESLIEKLNKAISNADKAVNEITLKPLERIFSATPNQKTMIQLRYGSKVFFDGIIDDTIIKGSAKNPNGLSNDDYTSKKALLTQILSMIQDNKQFDELYRTFSTKKTSAKSSKSNNSNKTKRKTNKTSKNNVKTEAQTEVKEVKNN